MISRHFTLREGVASNFCFCSFDIWQIGVLKKPEVHNYLGSREHVGRNKRGKLEVMLKSVARRGLSVRSVFDFPHSTGSENSRLLSFPACRCTWRVTSFPLPPISKKRKVVFSAPLKYGITPIERAKQKKCDSCSLGGSGFQIGNLNRKTSEATDTTTLSRKSHF